MDELINKYLLTEPATYGHFSGVQAMNSDIKPVSPEMKLAGFAYTVSIPGKDSCYLYKALNEAPEGAILVIDREGDNTYAAVGEMIVRNSIAKKIGGIVIDGPITDSIALKELGFPVFCKGISVITTNVWCVSGNVQKVVQCAGVPVQPGDLVIGNADGVVVISKDENLEEYLNKAIEIEKMEVKMRENFDNGIDQLLDVTPLIEANILGMINDKKALGRK